MYDLNGKNKKEDIVRMGGMPGVPEWLDLDVIVPVVATVVVICVGILVICVAVARRKQPQMTPGSWTLPRGLYNF